MSAASTPLIEVRGLKTAFGTHVVHDGLNLEVRRGEIMGLVGGSGTGKSVLMNTMIGLKRPDAGEIFYNGRALGKMADRERARLESHWGVLFQGGALFSALTVRENVMAPMREHTDLPRALMAELADMKIALTGLGPEAPAKFPAELSGGMKKRAGLARALALDPDVLFLDEPTAGLDPIGAAAFDSLIRELRDALGLTVFIVTHDLDTLFAICDRVAVLAEKRCVAVAPIDELLQNEHPWIREYFRGPRGRAATMAREG
ncbi:MULTISPECIES: ABC transporter ATP-binding protein [Hyphobacterium]|uniref:ABC transporter ATP-binding protein n=1 Tax=Hyphobacterium vulgare TaxID=1736751 RepID=A0ABV6ZZT7_9PROT